MNCLPLFLKGLVTENSSEFGDRKIVNVYCMMQD